MTLADFFKEHNKAALAFSGGADSSFLLYEAVRCGADVCAYYVNTAFQPAFELTDAKKVCAYIEVCGMRADRTEESNPDKMIADKVSEKSIRLRVLELDVLASETVASNPENRCYHCKQFLFSNIIRAAKEDGYTEVWDGTNASDDEEDRPGMRALQELRVLSPLRMCGLTKEEIRVRSRDAGLFTWNKPAYACLATRIPTGMPVTKENLARTEEAENLLFGMGFSDFRVRTTADGNALVQVREEDVPLLEKERGKIEDVLLKMYPEVAFGRR